MVNIFQGQPNVAEFFRLWLVECTIKKGDLLSLNIARILKPFFQTSLKKVSQQFC